jgi:hypothetical protein
VRAAAAAVSALRHSAACVLYNASASVILITNTLVASLCAFFDAQCSQKCNGTRRMTDCILFGTLHCCYCYSRKLQQLAQLYRNSGCISSIHHCYTSTVATSTELHALSSTTAAIRRCWLSAYSPVAVVGAGSCSAIAAYSKHLLIIFALFEGALAGYCECTVLTKAQPNQTPVPGFRVYAHAQQLLSNSQL